MIIGQLYFYETILDKFPVQLTSAHIDEVVLFGSEHLKKEDFDGLSRAEIIRRIKDIFSINYVTNVLEPQELTVAAYLWSELVKAQTTELSIDDPISDYQQEVHDWISNGALMSDVAYLLSTGRLVTDEQDYALYYGLHVLDTLTKALDLADKKLLQTENIFFGNVDELAVYHQIAVISDEFIAPLFTNLNCAFANLTDSVDETTSNITDVLQNNPSVELVLVVNPKNPQFVSHLTKKLHSGVLLSTFYTHAASDDAFFDTIVRKTLGVRLV